MCYYCIYCIRSNKVKNCRSTAVAPYCIHQVSACVFCVPFSFGSPSVDFKPASANCWLVVSVVSIVYSLLAITIAISLYVPLGIRTDPSLLGTDIH